MPVVTAGKRITDVSLRTVLFRACVNFAVRKVDVTVASQKWTTLNRQRQVGICSKNMYFLAPFQPGDESLLLFGQCLPAAYRVRFVQHAGVAHEVPVVLQRHVGVLRVGLSWILCIGPAHLSQRGTLRPQG